MTARHLIGKQVVELADGRRELVELHLEEHEGPDFFTIGVGIGFNAVSSRVTPQQLLDGYEDVLQGLTAFWLRDVISRHGTDITWKEVLRHCR